MNCEFEYSMIHSFPIPAQQILKVLVDLEGWNGMKFYRLLSTMKGREFGGKSVKKFSQLVL